MANIVLAPQDYHRYRLLLEGAVRRPDLTIAWADADDQRVLLVIGPPVTPATKLSVLRRLAEREALATDVVAPYLASGADDERTWLALAAPPGPSILSLAEWVADHPALGSRRAALRVLCDLATGLREISKRQSALPAGGIEDARIGADGRTVLSHLGELLPGPRLEDRELIGEIVAWLPRLCGDAADDEVARLVSRGEKGVIRHLVDLADELEALAEESEGAGHRRVLRWASQLVADHPAIAPPALLDEPPDRMNAPRRTPEPVHWGAPPQPPIEPVPSARGSEGWGSRGAPHAATWSRLEPDAPTGPVLYVEATPNGADAVGYSEAPAVPQSGANRTVSPGPLVATPRRRPERGPNGANTALAGALIGHKYEIVRRVENGMAGRVYEAVQIPDRRPMMVQLPHPRGEDEAVAGESRAAFRDEAERLRRLDHPHVVRVVDFGTEPEPWLALEPVEGPTLAKLLRSVNVVAPPDVVAFARAACGALGRAHELGVVHQNLQPANVILQGEQWHGAKLVNFGGVAAGVVGESTTDGSWLGAPHYLAPEQCQGETARVESDLYALGVLMYRLLTGRVPFEGKRGVALLEAHVRAAVPRLPPEVPRPLAHVVMRCLEKRPDHRYRSAADLDRALLSCQDPTTAPALAALEAARGTEDITEPVIVLPNGVALPGRWVAPLAAVFVLGMVLAGISATAGLFFWFAHLDSAESPPPAALPRVSPPTTPPRRETSPRSPEPAPASRAERPTSRPKPAGEPEPAREVPGAIAPASEPKSVSEPGGETEPVPPPVPRFTPGRPPGG